MKGVVKAIVFFKLLSCHHLYNISSARDVTFSDKFKVRNSNNLPQSLIKAYDFVKFLVDWGRSNPHAKFATKLS